MSEFKDENKILVPGEYLLDAVVIRSYNGFEMDVRKHVLELMINESISEYCLSGYVLLSDNLNLIRNIPLIGNEKLEIVFVTPSRPEKVKKTFFCYKIDGKTESSTNKGVALYRLHFVSEEFVENSKKKISLSFKDKKYSEMVYDIFSKSINSNKTLKTQTTVEKKNLVVPYMTPFQAIDMICLKSVSENKDKSYVFYEDLDGFYFTTINYRSQETDPVAEYTWFQTNLSEERDPIVLKDIMKEFSRIETYDFISQNNTINNIKNGLFASASLVHDITYKTLSVNNFSYNDDYYALNTMYPNGILPQNGDNFSKHIFSHYRFYPQTSYLHSDIELNDIYDKTMLERNAHFAQFENNRLSIVIAGDSDRRVGELVRINLPSVQPSYNSEEMYDPYISENYIITQITHIISPVGYKMRLYLERDSLPLAYPDNKTVEVQK
jgi:hypothetical protein